MRFAFSRYPTGALVVAAMALVPPTAASATSAAHAASAKSPSVPKAAASSLSGTTLTITWKKTSGTVEVKVRTTVAGRKRTKTRSAKASKGSLTVKVTGAKGAPLTTRAVKVQLRRCTGVGRAKRCSASSGWKRPGVPTGPGAKTPGSTVPGSATPGPGPGAGTTPAATPPTTPAGAGGPVPVIGGCPVLPADHAFNQDVSALPLDPRSQGYISFIGSGGRVHPDFGSADLGQGPGGFGIPYRVVPRNRPFVKTVFGDYADESDPVPGEVGYPIPLDTSIEGGPDSDGDRHVLVVRQEECKLYELGNAYPSGGGWEASGGAIWDLNTGKRPATAQPGWTSADAAGLPILPGLVRYDEVAAGVIRHAVRFTVAQTQRGYIAPASHFAPKSTDPNAPPMGLRLRMRADFDTSRFKGQSLVVVTALKRYGMIVADNGSNWYLSGAADPRWDDDDLNQLKAIPGSAFEVVKTGEIVRG